MRNSEWVSLFPSHPSGFTDKLMFLKKFLRSPRTIGSVTPSSRRLTEQMVAPVNWQEAAAVAELGAGTGVITQAILERKRTDCTALIFEQDEEMRSQLVRRFPDLCHWRNARELTEAMRACGINSLDAVISGLPFANFSPSLRHQLLDQIESALRPGGMFVAFQYSLQMREQLRKRFSDVEVRFVPQNIPFAFVYVCRK
jgi:phospholipid N-methyltransferase